MTGGTVVTPAGPLAADVVIEDGRIAALVRPGRVPSAPERLDASGCLVLPGGVDPHCHIMADVAAATRAAVLGGTTSLLAFTNPAPGEGPVGCVLRHREELTGGAAAVDVGLHTMLYQPAEVADLAALQDAGVSGIKVFLAYSELGIMWSARGLFELMATAARHGQVVQVHCEEGELIADLLIWDPGVETIITADTFDDRTGDSVYAGERLAGRVRDVLLRGRAVVRQGLFVGGIGTYLPSSGPVGAAAAAP